MDLTELPKRAPEAYEELIAARGILEREFEDMQDFEFTVEDGRLLMLQARSGKRTPLAALRIAHDMVAEGLISPEMALDRLKDIDLDAVAEMRFAHDPDQSPLMRGTAAGAGVAVGAAVFDPNRVTEMRAKGQPVILLRENAETADIEALSQAAGLISAQGARTSHAAVVARQLGKPCIVGCANLVIEANYRSATTGNERISEGDILSIDGGNGEIFRGALSIVEDRPAALLDAVAAWREARKAEAKKRTRKASRS
jgi:pyruvate,orthophosphate dikinase